MARHAEAMREWSEWDEVRTALVVHGRQSREGSGRAQRELPRYKGVISYRLQKTAS